MDQLNHTGIATLGTPCLLLDEARMARNIARMQQTVGRLGVTFRAHAKTAKSIEVVERMAGPPPAPLTVSTLEEAERFAAAGYRDLLYAVGIAPAKLERVIALRHAGVDLTVITDNVEAAGAVAAAGRAAGDAIPALVEVDSDGGRAGIDPGQPERLRVVAAALADGARVKGVMTHCGNSYSGRTPEQLCEWAERERAAVVSAAGILRESGHAMEIVSVGSTPTVLFAEHLDGVTEARTGVYVFNDLVMAGIGTCTVDEIALSVLATVIGAQPERGRYLVDAGWTALSRDRGTAAQAVDQGLGLVCDLEGRPYGDLIVESANQEHGIIALREGATRTLPSLAVGDLVRILPNHACATAAQHDHYNVVTEDCSLPRWERFGGW